MNVTVALRRISLFILLVSFFASCTKELTPIGLNLLSEDEMLQMGYTDTASIVAYSVSEDSVYTQELSSNYIGLAYIGSMNDPIFGQTNAALYTQIKTTTSRVRFGTSPIFDSAYLLLPLQGNSFGDTMTNMTFKVYELSESIIDSVHAYSNSSIAYNPADLLGQITIQPRPHDSSYYNGKKRAPMLRIPINSLFGNKILNIQDTNTLNSATEFVKYFKGICIVAEPQNNPNSGSILVTKVAVDESRLLMYYHNTADTLTYSFAINSDCSRFNGYTHNNYNGALPQLKQQLAGDTLLGKEFLFLQGMGGVKVKIKFPYLKSWFNNQKVVINDAQLVLTNASASDVFKNPSTLTLRAVGETGSTSPFTLIDEDDANGYFDGVYNSSTRSYRFNLKRYVQQVMTGEIDNRNGLYLIIPSGSYTGTRLVLHGTDSPQSDIKLYIRFTKID